MCHIRRAVSQLSYSWPPWTTFVSSDKTGVWSAFLSVISMWADKKSLTTLTQYSLVLSELQPWSSAGTHSYGLTQSQAHQSLLGQNPTAKLNLGFWDITWWAARGGGGDDPSPGQVILNVSCGRFPLWADPRPWREWDTAQTEDDGTKWMSSMIDAAASTLMWSAVFWSFNGALAVILESVAEGHSTIKFIQL